MIQLHRLEGFYWVATCGGYAAAARAFPYPITQPGVYQQVRKLEEDLGAELFERVGHDRMALTPSGRRLYEFCAPFFRELPNVLRDLAHGAWAGPLRIDAGALEVNHVLPRWIKRVRRAHPELGIEVRSLAQPDLERVRRGETDLLVEYVTEVSSDLCTKVIATHYAFVVIPSDWPMARRRRVRLEELVGETLIAFDPGERGQRMQLAALRSRGIEPAHVITTTEVDSVLAFVEAGLGYSVLPWPDRKGPVRNGVRAIRQTGPDTSFPVSAIWREQAAIGEWLEAALSVPFR